MGIEQHHAVLASTWDPKSAARLQTYVREKKLLVTTREAPINGIVTFVLHPDGSKDGWDESDKGDRVRAELIEFLRTDGRYEDGGSPWMWVEVTRGERGSEIENTNCEEDLYAE
jgi:hypothetical protein